MLHCRNFFTSLETVYIFDHNKFVSLLLHGYWPFKHSCYVNIAAQAYFAVLTDCSLNKTAKQHRNKSQEIIMDFFNVATDKMIDNIKSVVQQGSHPGMTRRVPVWVKKNHRTADASWHWEFLFKRVVPFLQKILNGVMTKSVTKYNTVEDNAEESRSNPMLAAVFHQILRIWLHLFT